MLHAVEYGLIRKWLKDASRNEIRVHAPKKKFYSRRSFTFFDLYPIFLVWIVGICLSLIVFVNELIISRLIYVNLPYTE